MNRDKRVERAQMRVLFQVPFFAPAIMRLPVIWDASIPTACTDGEKIRWNPDWFDKLPDAVLPTVLCHEAEHCLFGHLWRMPQGGDWQQWNMATDHEINLSLKEFSKVVMAQRVADPFPFPDPQDSYLADPQYAGMSCEQIYARMGNKPKNPGGKNPGKGSGPTNNQPDPHSMPEFGQMSQPMERGARLKSLSSEWEGMLLQSVKIAQSRGECPESLARLVDKLVDPGVPWWERMRAWLREQCSDDWDFLTPCMEMSESGFIMPSLKSEKCGPVVFATDTSGSIDMEMLAKFNAQKQGCLDEMRPRKLVDIQCDCTIGKIDEYTPGDTISQKLTGGGGTDFRPVFVHVDNQPEKPKCMVYLTDLYGAFPDQAPDYPVLWVTWSKDQKAPWGETIYASQD